MLPIHDIRKILRERLSAALREGDVLEEIRTLHLFYISNAAGEDPLDITGDFRKFERYSKRIRSIATELAESKEIHKGFVKAFLTDTLRDTLIYYEEFFAKGGITPRKILFDGLAYILGRLEDVSFIEGAKGATGKKLQSFREDMLEDLWDEIISNNENSKMSYEDSDRIDKALNGFLESLGNLSEENQVALLVRIYGLMATIRLYSALGKCEGKATTKTTKRP